MTEKKPIKDQLWGRGYVGMKTVTLDLTPKDFHLTFFENSSLSLRVQEALTSEIMPTSGKSYIAFEKANGSL